jgi:hypothetical protein
VCASFYLQFIYYSDVTVTVQLSILHITGTSDIPVTIMTSSPIYTIPTQKPITAIFGHSFLRHVPSCYDYSCDPLAPLIYCQPGGHVHHLTESLTILPSSVLSLVLCIGSNELSCPHANPGEIARNLHTLVEGVFSTTSVKHVGIFMPGYRIPKAHAQPRHMRYCDHFNNRVRDFRQHLEALFFHGDVTFLDTGLDGSSISRRLYRWSDGYHPSSQGTEVIFRRATRFFANSLLSRAESYLNRVKQYDRIARHQNFVTSQAQSSSSATSEAPILSPRAQLPLTQPLFAQSLPPPTAFPAEPPRALPSCAGPRQGHPLQGRASPVATAVPIPRETAVATQDLHARYRANPEYLPQVTTSNRFSALTEETTDNGPNLPSEIFTLTPLPQRQKALPHRLPTTRPIPTLPSQGQSQAALHQGVPSSPNIVQDSPITILNPPVTALPHCTSPSSCPVGPSHVPLIPTPTPVQNQPCTPQAFHSTSFGHVLMHTSACIGPPESHLETNSERPAFIVPQLSLGAPPSPPTNETSNSVLTQTSPFINAVPALCNCYQPPVSLNHLPEEQPAPVFHAIPTPPPLALPDTSLNPQGQVAPTDIRSQQSFLRQSPSAAARDNPLARVLSAPSILLQGDVPAAQTNGIPPVSAPEPLSLTPYNLRSRPHST